MEESHSQDAYAVTGTVCRINDAKTFKSGAKSRSFWLEQKTKLQNGNEISNVLEFELFSGAQSRFDNTKDLDAIRVGDTVSFRFVLRGSVWKGNPPKPEAEHRCFVSLRVMSKITVASSAPQASKTGTPPPPPKVVLPVDSDDNDMPF